MAELKCRIAGLFHFTRPAFRGSAEPLDVAPAQAEQILAEQLQTQSMIELLPCVFVVLVLVAVVLLAVAAVAVVREGRR